MNRVFLIVQGIALREDGKEFFYCPYFTDEVGRRIERSIRRLGDEVWLKEVVLGKVRGDGKNYLTVEAGGIAGGIVFFFPLIYPLLTDLGKMAGDGELRFVVQRVSDSNSFEISFPLPQKAISTLTTIANFLKKRN